MDERLRFIARLLDGEQMAAVCRGINISRKTGYKLLKHKRSSVEDRRIIDCEPNPVIGAMKAAEAKRRNIIFE